MPCVLLCQRILGLLPDHKLADFLTSLVDTTFDEKLEVLEAVDLSKRFPLAMALLQRQVSVRDGREQVSVEGRVCKIKCQWGEGDVV